MLSGSASAPLATPKNAPYSPSRTKPKRPRRSQASRTRAEICLRSSSHDTTSPNRKFHSWSQ